MVNSLYFSLLIFHEAFFPVSFRFRHRLCDLAVEGVDEIASNASIAGTGGAGPHISGAATQTAYPDFCVDRYLRPLHVRRDSFFL